METLINTEALQRAIFNSANFSSIATDAKGVIQIFNVGAERMLGYTADEVMNKITPADISDPQEVIMRAETLSVELDTPIAPGFEALVFKASRGIEDIYELTYIRKDGSRFPAVVSVTALRDAQETIIGYLLIGTDNTARKLAEEALLKEGALRHAQKMEAVGILAGGIAHDFNNMLGIILGNTELAILGMSDLKEAMENIQVAANRGRYLIIQLLAFSRNKPASKQLVDPVPLIHEVLKLLQSTMPSSIKIRKNIQYDRSTICGDPTEIQQIIMNLCSNASQSMEDKGGLLTVGVKSLLVDIEKAKLLSIEPNFYIEILVEDTGSGMSKEVQEHIFEPFFTTKPQGKGTGLGLSVVHGAVRNSGGGIQVESEPGKGTTFKVYLPRISESCETDVNISEEIALKRGSGNVMFVDDESALVDVGIRMLKGLGYLPTGFTDPKKALAEFMSAPDSFAAVVTDQMMFGMTGTDLAVRILNVRPDIPIFLCTGFSETVNEVYAAKIGFRGFFLKPVAMTDLAKALKKATAPHNDC